MPSEDAKVGHSLNPISWTIQEGIAAFPQARVALGVAAVAAAAALALGFFQSPLVAVGAVCVMLILMVLLRLFSRGNVVSPWPSIVLTWFCLLLFMAVAVLIISSVFFRVPRPFPELLDRNSDAGPQARLPTRAETTDPATRIEASVGPTPKAAPKVTEKPTPDFLAAKEFNEGGTYPLFPETVSLELGFCSAQQSCVMSVTVAGQTAIPQGTYNSSAPIAFKFRQLDYLLKLGMIGDSSAFVSVFPARMPSGRPPSPAFSGPSNYLEGSTHVLLGGRVAINLGDCQASSGCWLSIDVDGRPAVSVGRFGPGSSIPFRFRGQEYVLRLGQIGESDVSMSAYPSP